VDAEGRLLGVNALRLEGGLILAVPATESVKERTLAMTRGEATPRLRLGVAVAPPRVARRMRRAVGLPEREGLLVRGVEADGPAGSAGIERGDLLIATAGRELRGVDSLYEVLDGLAPGDAIDLTVLRGAEERTVPAGATS
jgi:S1-C subfamily serine protease